LNTVDYSVCGILQEKVYKTLIADLDPSTTPLTNGCRNDDVIQLGPAPFSVAVLAEQARPAIHHSSCLISGFGSAIPKVRHYCANI